MKRALGSLALAGVFSLIAGAGMGAARGQYGPGSSYGAYPGAERGGAAYGTGYGTGYGAGYRPYTCPPGGGSVRDSYYGTPGPIGGAYPGGACAGGYPGQIPSPAARQGYYEGLRYYE